MAKAKKAKKPRHTRLIDNPLFESTSAKRSSFGKSLAAKVAKVATAVRPKTPVKPKLMSATLFRSSSKSPRHSVTIVKAKAKASVKAVVSRIKHVRKVHHEFLKKMKLHKSMRKAGALHRIEKKKPIEHRIKTAKGGLNDFAYWLGKKVSSSKTLFETQKAG